MVSMKKRKHIGRRMKDRKKRTERVGKEVREGQTDSHSRFSAKSNLMSDEGRWRVVNVSTMWVNINISLILRANVTIGS